MREQAIAEATREYVEDDELDADWLEEELEFVLCFDIERNKLAALLDINSRAGLH